MIEGIGYCVSELWESPDSDLVSGRWFEEEVLQRGKDVPGLEPKECSTF